MTTKQKAVVIGGSIGGLMAALFLRSIDFDVEVYERSGVYLSGRGAGIVSHPELEEMLLGLGISDPVDLGFLTNDRKFFNKDGVATVVFPRDQIQFSWNKLYNSLLDLLGREKYHLSHDLLRTGHASREAKAFFANGAVVEADLLVGADGMGSRVRQLHVPTVQPTYAGYVGWRGIVEARLLPREVNEEIESTFVMSTPGNEQFVGYPVITEQDGATIKCYNFVWYRPAPAETTLRDLLTDRSGTTHSVGIPPPLIRPEVLEQVKTDADQVLPRQLAAVVRATPQPFLQPIYDLVSTQIVFGRNVILGDAAFVARPHVGAGVTKAATDARTLATCLAEEPSIDRALARYQNLRLNEGLQIVNQARHLGRALIGGSKIDEKELLDETAWLSFLKQNLKQEDSMTELNADHGNWPEEVKRDLAENAFNPRVGSDLVSETDRVRVWHLVLKPGERTPFHRHVLDYFWTCHSHGTTKSYFENGQVSEASYAPGDTKHMSYDEGQYLLHSLENTGDCALIFTTVEFKYSANSPLPVGKPDKAA